MIKLQFLSPSTTCTFYTNSQSYTFSTQIVILLVPDLILALIVLKIVSSDH